MKSGMVVFAGAGPGAPDLMTVRCREAIASADVIVYAGSLVNPELLRFARPECRTYDSAGMDLNEAVRVMTESARAGEKVLRLHTGDPAIYGAIAEQMRALDKAGIPYEVIPGVSSVFACAAALKAELTLPGVSQTVILTRRAGRTPVPAGQEIPALAAHRATMAVFLSADEMTALVDELRAGGYAPDTPAAVVYRASWPDERTIRGTLVDIAAKAAEAGIVRQAMLLVGGALGGEGEASRLYAADFSHGYRTATETPAPAAAGRTAAFAGRVAVYALTAAGAVVARRLASAIGAALFLSRDRVEAQDSDDGTVSWFDAAQLDELMARQWRRYDGHVFVMAAGIVVRKIAPLLTAKTSDPAVVVCDEKGRFAVSLLAGHIGGANRLAGEVAAVLGGQAVVTTATDTQGVVAFDELAARYGWRIENPAAIKELNSLLLARGKIGLVLPVELAREFYGDREHIRVVDSSSLPSDLAGLVALDCPDLAAGLALPVLHLTRLGVVLGIGCNRGTSADDIEHAVRTTLKAWHIDEKQVRKAASVDLKQDEAGLHEWAARHPWPLTFLAADRLKAIPVPNPSATVEAATGTPSVAEAAALAVAGGRLLVPKQKKGGVTVAVALCADTSPREPRAGRVLAVGIGSGTPEGITGRARTAILSADVVVGYKPYCDQILWLTGRKRVMATGMRDEVRRCREALDEAARGQTVAVVCSGDAGVYGMAGLLMELLHERGQDDVQVEVVPGVTSALDAAAALGAPLMNDYATISLSDLLTPRATIVERLRAVAACGMACVLYNPRSRQRHSLFEEAIRMFADARGDGLACGFVRDAGRQGQETWVGPLRDLPVERVDMSTLVVFGSQDTVLLNGRLITRRGYRVGEGAREDRG